MMIRRLAAFGIAAVALSANACDKKAPEAPAVATVTAPAAAPAAATAPATPAPAEAVAAAEPAGSADKAADPHAGCAAHADEHQEAAAKPADGTPSPKVHMGEAFTIETEKALGEVLASATDGESTVRVTGTIEKVCQKKGCWMVVRDGDMEARVIMKDYGFVVPMDSAGKKTSVEGVLKVKVFNEAQARHLAEDGGEDPNAVKGEKKEFLLTASAIDIGG